MRWLFVLAVLGCGSQEAPSEPAEPPIGPAPEPRVEAPPEEEATAYEIHEWGLIDVDLSTQEVELASGPGRAVVAQAPPPRPPRPLTGIGVGRPRKPVLYFHLRDSNPSFTFDLTVHLGVALREHWPEAEVSEGTIRWANVGLAREHCAGGPYPTSADPRCQSVADGVCEVAELETYVTSDSGCLRVDGREHNLLFYRGEGPVPPLPVTITRGDAIEVRNDSMGAPIGEVLRFVRASGGAIHVSMAPMPSEGASVSLPMPTEAATDAHRQAIVAQLRALGMTESEADAFGRAWFGELFDGTAPTPHAFADAVLFFLPQDRIDAYARLEASPPPAIVRRAMALRAGWP